MNSQPDEDDVKFARSLVNPEKSIRDKTLATFRKYLASQSSLEHMEMLKIWKALYYCMWLSDKQPIQAELAQNLCDLMDVFSTPQLSLLYLRMFFRIMLREWAHLDQYRVNKFYSLIRLMFRKALSTACKASWSSDLAHAVLTIVDEEVLTKKPNGIRYHIADIYLSELHQVTNGDINTRDFLTVVKPVQDCLLRLGDNADFTDRLYKEVFNKFASHFAAENAASGESKEGAEEKKVFAGVNTKALQKIVFDLAAEEATPNPCRKKLYELHKVLAARSGANFVSESLDELLGKKSAAKAAATPGRKDKKEAGKKETAPAVVPPVTPKAPAAAPTTTPAAATEKSEKKTDKKSEKKAKRAHSEIEEVQEEVPAEKAPKSALKSAMKSAVKAEAAPAEPAAKKDKTDKGEKKKEVEGEKKKEVEGEKKKEVEGEKSAKKAKATKDSAPETSSTTPSSKAAKRDESSSPASSAATTTSAPEAAAAPPKFIPSAKFAGRKPGYVFHKDKQGLGYYWDAVQARQLARKSVGGSSNGGSNSSGSAKKTSSSQSAPSSARKNKH